MNAAIITALGAIAVALIALAGTVYTAKTTRASTEKAAEMAAERVSSLTIYRIDQLEKKVDKHNSLIEWRAGAEERLRFCEQAIGKED